MRRRVAPERRYGSEADMISRSCDVCFSPKVDMAPRPIHFTGVGLLMVGWASR